MKNQRKRQQTHPPGNPGLVIAACQSSAPHLGDKSPPQLWLSPTHDVVVDAWKVLEEGTQGNATFECLYPPITGVALPLLHGYFAPGGSPIVTCQCLMLVTDRKVSVPAGLDSGRFSLIRTRSKLRAGSIRT